MRVVIQRVTQASVSINDTIKAQIGKGLLVLVGIEADDTEEDVKWLCNKITNLRIMYDADGNMNLSVKEIDGEILAVSQFTLHAQTKKGNRPSFIKAAKPAFAIPLYEHFIKELENQLDKKIGTGTFGAYMQVALVNDGPVNITIDSKNKE